MFRTYPLWAMRFGRLLVFASAALILIDRFGPTFGLNLSLQRLTTPLYEWVLILGAFALILGVAHVALVHFMHVVSGKEEWMMSLALVVSLLIVTVLGLLSPGGTLANMMEWVFDSLIAPGQATLFSLLAFSMAAAAFRALRVDQPGGAWMLAGAVIVFLAQMPLSGVSLPVWIGTTADWLLETPAMAAMRGALLGAGLAAGLVGLRLLLHGDGNR